MTSLIVVAIFVLVKFTEGAWLVVILFIIGVPALIRLNREYGMEAQVLERISDRPKPPAAPNYTRRTVFVFVDSFDLATIAALRYARSLRPTTLRAVHFVIDTAVADALREEWTRAGMDVVLDFIDCPDRRIARAAAELASAEAAQPGVQVTVVLPRRSYSPLIGRLLHDRTADKIAAVVSRIPHAAATIVPFDVQSRLEVLHARQVAQAERSGRRGQDEPQGPRGAGGQEARRRRPPAPPQRTRAAGGHRGPAAPAGAADAAAGPGHARTAARRAATAPPRSRTPPPDCPPSSPRRPGCAGCCAGGGAARTSRPRRRRPRIIPATTGPPRPPG